MIRSLALACALLVPAAAHAATSNPFVIAMPDISYPSYAHDFSGVFCTSPQAAVDFDRNASSLRSDKEVLNYLPHFNAGRADVCGLDSFTVFDRPKMVKAYGSGLDLRYIYEFSLEGKPRLYSWLHRLYAPGPQYVV